MVSQDGYIRMIKEKVNGSMIGTDKYIIVREAECLSRVSPTAVSLLNSASELSKKFPSNGKSDKCLMRTF